MRFLKNCSNASVLCTSKEKALYSRTMEARRTVTKQVSFIFLLLSTMHIPVSPATSITPSTYPFSPPPRLHFHLLRVKEKISWSEYTICKNCCLGDTIVYQSNSEFSSHMQKNTQYLRPHSGKAEE